MSWSGRLATAFAKLNLLRTSPDRLRHNSIEAKMSSSSLGPLETSVLRYSKQSLRKLRLTKRSESSRLNLLRFHSRYRSYKE